MTPAAAALHAGCSCSPTHPAAERQPRSADVSFERLTGVDVCTYCVLLDSASSHWQSLGLSSWVLADCAQKIGIPDYPVRVKPDVTRDATSGIYTAAH